MFIKMFKTLDRLILAGFLLASISACSEQSSISSSVTEADNDTGMVTLEQSALDIGTALDNGIGQIYSPLRALRVTDTDGDGLSDSVDPDPQNTPQPADATGANTFMLEAVYSLDGDHNLDAALLQGAVIELRSSGSQFYTGNPWVVFETSAGFIAERPQQMAADIWQVSTPERYAAIQGIHLIKGGYRTNTVKTRLLRRNQPRLYPFETPVMAGDTIVLQGRNMQRVDRVLLGSKVLDIKVKNDDSITVVLPESSLGRQLVLETDGKQGNVQFIDYRHDVELSVSGRLQAVSGRQFSTYYNGEQITLAGRSSLTLKFPADRPVVLNWDILDGNGVMLPGNLTTLVFPAQQAVKIGARNSLLAEIYNLRNYADFSPVDNWNSAWDQLVELQGFAEADRYVEALNRKLTEQLDFEQQKLLKQLLQQINPALFAVTAPIDTGTSAVRATRPVDTITGDLDEVIPVVVSHRSIIGRAAFAGFSVNAHGDCDFTIESLTAPDNLWPTDLCIKNRSKVYASAAVYITEDRDTRSYDRRKDIVNSGHISNWFDPGMIGGAWGFLDLFPSVAYLTRKNGDPLCKMRTCFVEILTGGLTSYQGEAPFNKPLSSSEQRVVNILLARTVVEQFLLPIIEIVTGSDESTPEGRCLVRKVLSDSGLYFPTTLDFSAKYRATSGLTDVLAAFNDTYGKFIIDKLLSRDAAACLPAAITGNMLGRLENKLGYFAGSTVGYYKVAEKLKTALHAFITTITPEKIIYRISPRAEVINIFPADIDLEDVGGKIYIHGNQLALQSGTGDPERHPKLVIEDRRNNKVEMQLDATHLAPDLSGDYFTNTRHEIPLLELLPFLAELESGPVRFIFKLDHRDFPGFPDKELPVPANRTIKLSGLPRISGFSPSMVYPGQRVSVSGQRFDLFSSANQVLLMNSDGDLLDVMNPEFISDRELIFDMPDSIVAGAYSIVLYSDTSDLISDKDLAVSEIVIPTVTFIDDGPSYDDSMTLVLNDKDDNVVDFYEIPVASTGEYRLTTFWNNLELATPVTGFSVSCDDPGSNGTCTYSLELTNANICKLAGDSTTDCASGEIAGFIKGGQLAPGESVYYGLR